VEASKQIRFEDVQPDFQRLSLGVQKFVALYLCNGRDKIAACLVSHPHCKSPAVLGCQILGRARVRRIINTFDQRSGVQTTLDKVERLIKHARRDGTRMKTLVAPLTRVAKALERLAASEASHVG